MVVPIVRFVLAVLLAPLSALIAIGVLMILYGILFDQESFEVGLNFELFATYGLPIAYIATIFLGIPTNLLLRRAKRATVRNHAFVGAVLGLFFGIVFFGLGRSAGENLALTAAYGGLVVIPGATVAAVFAAIAGKGGPTHGVADAT